MDSPRSTGLTHAHTPQSDRRQRQRNAPTSLLDKLSIAPLDPSAKVGSPQPSQTTQRAKLAHPIHHQHQSTAETPSSKCPSSPLRTLAREISWSNMESMSTTTTDKPGRADSTLAPPSSPLRNVARKISWSNMESVLTTDQPDRADSTLAPPSSPLRNVARKISWSNMESLIETTKTDHPSQGASVLRPPSSPLRSIAQKLSWSNMEFDEVKIAKENRKSSSPQRKRRETGGPQRKTLRQRSSSLSKLERLGSQRINDVVNYKEKGEALDRKIMRKRSTSLTKLVKGPTSSAETAPQRSRGKQSLAAKSFSVQNLRSFSPNRKRREVSDARTKKVVSPKPGNSDQQRNPLRSSQTNSRGHSPLKSMVKSLSVQNFRAFSPTRTKRDALDIRPKKDKRRTEKTVRDGLAQQVEIPSHRSESPLKSLASTLSFRRPSSPAKERKQEMTKRHEEQRKASRDKSPAKWKKNESTSLQRHLSLSALQTTKHTDTVSVGSSRAGSRLRMERALSKYSLCSKTETAAVDTSTREAAVHAAEVVRSCSPERRNMQDRNNNARRGSLSPMRRTASPTRRSNQANQQLSASMHCSPRRYTGDHRDPLRSASTHTPTKGMRKQLSTRRVDHPVGSVSSPKDDRMLSPKSAHQQEQFSSRQRSARKLVSPKPDKGSVSPKAGLGLASSLHREPSQRVRGMKHPPQTKLNNTVPFPS